MNSTGLVESFRRAVSDTKKPYFWTDDDVLEYAADAQRMFVRLTGGVSDFLSDACVVNIVTDDPLGVLHPSILRIMSATRRSDSRPIEIINQTDLGKLRSSDYGRIKPLLLDNKQGEVRYGVIGMQKGYVRWVQVPAFDDMADLHIYRLPLNIISGFDQEIEDVEEEHHLHLIDWMKHLGYKKPDSDAFNPQASDKAEVAFRNYCTQVKSEWERYKHKNREVQYGGL